MSSSASGTSKDPDSRAPWGPIQPRLLAEDLVRIRRPDEQRRYASSQRQGRVDANPHQIDAVVFALRRIPDGGCILADVVGLARDVRRLHESLGNPMATWKDAKAVWIQPEDIKIDDDGEREPVE